MSTHHDLATEYNSLTDERQEILRRLDEIKEIQRDLLDTISDGTHGVIHRGDYIEAVAL